MKPTVLWTSSPFNEAARVLDLDDLVYIFCMSVYVDAYTRL